MKWTLDCIYSIYGNLAWDDLYDDEQLKATLVGKTITEAEAVDYPLTDELCFCLTDADGNFYILEIGLDPEKDFYYQNPCDNPFYARIARVPTEKTI